MKQLFSKLLLGSVVTAVSFFGLNTPQNNTTPSLFFSFGTIAHAQVRPSSSQIETIDFTVGRLVQTDRLKGLWVEYDFRGKERYRFDTVRQDAGSILLRGQNGGVDLLVDLSNKMISGEWTNHPMKKLYTIAQVKLFDAGLGDVAGTQITSASSAATPPPKTVKSEKLFNRIIPKIISPRKGPQPQPQNEGATKPVTKTAELAKTPKVNIQDNETALPDIDADLPNSPAPKKATWPIEGNEGSSEMGEANLIPSSIPSNINIIRYENGYFEKIEGGLWLERTPGGENLKYKKIGETTDSLYFYNQSRNIFIKIDVKGKRSLVSQNGESLRSYYALDAMGAMTGGISPVTPIKPVATVIEASVKKGRFDLPFLAKKSGKLSIIERSKCLAKGGTVERAGIVNAERCTLPFTDGGKVCIDSSNCEGKCVVEGTQNNNGAFSGLCQVDDNPFGCYAEVVAGEAQPALCVD